MPRVAGVVDLHLESVMHCVPSSDLFLRRCLHPVDHRRRKLVVRLALDSFRLFSELAQDAVVNSDEDARVRSRLFGAIDDAVADEPDVPGSRTGTTGGKRLAVLVSAAGYDRLAAMEEFRRQLTEIFETEDAPADR